MNLENEKKPNKAKEKRRSQTAFFPFFFLCSTKLSYVLLSYSLPPSLPSFPYRRKHVAVSSSFSFEAGAIRPLEH